MSGWARRRVWTAAKVLPAPGGWTVHLDDKPVMTPARAPLVVPTPAMAEAIAAEWQAQDKVVDPRTMPVTRMANSALDKVAPSHAAVVAHLAAYGETDLLCYRAETPAELAARQAEAWDPLLDWAAEALGARLRVGVGVLPVMQDRAALDRLSARVAAHDTFALTGLHDLVALSGSLVLGLAVAEARLEADAAWVLSRLDEDWQIAQWGEDDEATASAQARRDGFVTAARFLQWARK
ncbi:MAG: ATPase [Limimaricola sp.]|uniref:ATP12 family chaperone protein n=1 Tax=Limimaricola sp. TaxID=2211665 RepID=UPI001DDCB5EE|nr:ATP12 family protein [Limimaricola sp.]MBI1415618.1 ATPase [Limimaricola sp.]